MDGDTFAAIRGALDTELKTVDDEIIAIDLHRNQLLERRSEIKLQIEELENAKSAKAASTDYETGTFPWDQEVNHVLNEVFHIQRFRDLQRSAVNLALSGEDCLVVMSTGAGKSLCYQLPAILPSRPGITLVIQPLLSLVEDQLIQLRRIDVQAASFNQHTTKDEANFINTAICDKNDAPLRLLFVTPEKLSKSKRFMNKLEKCYKNGRLRMLVIDEIHCLSQWGHDFRPDYKFLGILKRQFPSVPIMGLTATATATVLNDIKNILNIKLCRTLKTGLNRANLFYEVRKKPEKGDNVVKEIAALLKNDFLGQCGIIYCLSRKDCEELTKSLKKLDISADFYHADLTGNNRTKIHNRWLDGTCQVIVATLAVGMGIDKPDVRFVIHHSVAKSMENYYQESGRAGRDGAPARVIVFYRLADIFRQSTLNYTDRTRDNLYGMMYYCIQSTQCRRASIAHHFGERFEQSWCDNACDNCARSTPNITQLDIAPFYTQISNIIADAKHTSDQGRITGNKLSELLTKKMPEFSRELLEMIIGFFLIEGFLREDFHFTPYSVISYVVAGRRLSAVQQQQYKFPIDTATLNALKTGPSSSKRKRSSIV